MINVYNTQIKRGKNMTEKSYCILSIQKVKSFNSLNERHLHNFRKIPTINAEDFSQNEELIDKTGMDYKTLWYNRLQQEKLLQGKEVAVRKNSVLAYEIVTTFSRNADIDIEKWKQQNIKWMQQTFGPENVISMQYHGDEATPHIHTIIVPIDERGHLCARNFTGGRKQIMELHDSYSKAMEPLGLKRGERLSKTKKNDLKRFYKQINEAIETKVPELEHGETVDSYVHRVNEFVQNRELYFVHEKLVMQRKLELEKTKFIQFYNHYKEAIILQNDIEKNMYGDKKLIQERLQTYRKIEHSVPRKKLAIFL